MDMPKERFDSDSSEKLDAVADRYETQSYKFKKAARDLDCDTDEQRWDATLKKVVKHKPVEKRP